MVKNGARYCDCCEEEIPKGVKFKHAFPEKEQLAFLQTQDDPDIKFTWTEHQGGKISMDICLECVLNMGPMPGEEEIN